MKSAPLGWMQTLADATRVRLLRLLERQELSVSELCTIVQLPQSTVSRHLKVLSADSWIINRRDGTNQLYSTVAGTWDAARNDLWHWVRMQADTPTTDQDEQRLEQVVSSRFRGEAFFASAAEHWDNLRTELFGKQVDAFTLAASVSPDATVGELGCGSAPISQLVAPYAKHVYAVDNSSAMLAAAEQRVGKLENVTVLNSPLTNLAIPNETLDIAWLTVVLPYLVSPPEVLREAARTMCPRATLVIVDLLPHERASYQQEMRHLRLGTDREQLITWLDEAGMSLALYQPLPPDPNAKGPALFSAVARKKQ